MSNQKKNNETEKNETTKSFKHFKFEVLSDTFSDRHQNDV